MSPQPASHIAPEPIQVMVVDDSAVVRTLVSRQLSADPEVEVVASAPDGEAALSVLRRRPVDVVVLDVEMPVMDGLTALPLILSARPGIKVLMASSLTRHNADISLRALELGASDFVAKPDATPGAAEAFQRELLAKVKALGQGRRAILEPASPVILPRRSTQPARPTVLAIGASTGGPPALIQVFEALRGAVNQPIFVTQHMPPVFTASFADRLSEAGGRACAEAKHGEPVRQGRTYVAPGGWHMTVVKGASGPEIALTQEPPEHFCRPAVDPMMRSLSSVFGGGVLGAILTGMGSDGAAGCAGVVRAGGRFIVQDEATSVVWGMPGAAAHTGLAEKILPISEIGPWLAQSMR